MAAEKLDWGGAVRSIAEAGKQIVSLEDQVKKSQDSSAANALWELDQVRGRINHALRRRRGDQNCFQLRTAANLSPGEGFTCAPKSRIATICRQHFRKPELRAALRLEHHEAGRKRRVDEFQCGRSRRGENAACARRFSLPVSAAACECVHACGG